MDKELIAKLKKCRNITKEDIIIMIEDDLFKCFDQILITPLPKIAYDEKHRLRKVGRLETIFEDYTFDGDNIDVFLKNNMDISRKIIEALNKKSSLDNKTDVV